MQKIEQQEAKEAIEKRAQKDAENKKIEEEKRKIQDEIDRKQNAQNEYQKNMI